MFRVGEAVTRGCSGFGDGAKGCCPAIQDRALEKLDSHVQHHLWRGSSAGATVEAVEIRVEFVFAPPGGVGAWVVEIYVKSRFQDVFSAKAGFCLRASAQNQRGSSGMSSEAIAKICS